MRIFRKLRPELKHHRLIDLISEYNLDGGNQHRALADCYYTYNGYIILKDLAISKYGTIDEYRKAFARNRSKYDLRTLVANSDPNPDSPLYQKRCVFTGVLSQFTREQAGQIVVNIGGFCDNAITKKTNYLIMGCNDYCPLIKDGKSTKQKKAEQYILDECDISIITENEFYSMIEEE